MYHTSSLLATASVGDSSSIRTVVLHLVAHALKFERLQGFDEASEADQVAAQESALAPILPDLYSSPSSLVRG